MSAAWKALLVESAPTPIDSLKSIAGSSDKSDFTTSIFADDSHLGISASLCVHSSGWSVLRQSSHTLRTKQHREVNTTGPLLGSVG